MKKLPFKFNEAFLFEPSVYRDNRGFFMESYSKDKFKELTGQDITFLQDNHSLSKEAGVIRGLHYQKFPMEQSKLVRVTSGAIYDVIVDIRTSSPTFGQWAYAILSNENNRQLFVPKGFAHGFCTLVPDTEVQYKVDACYSPEHDRGILWNDPFLNIDWPASTPVLSNKDQIHPLLKDADLD